MRPFIGDGYDQEFYIAGGATYPPMRFAGRVMACHESLPHCVRVLDAGVATPDDHKRCFAAVAEKINGWSYRDDDGTWKPVCDHEDKPLPINGETLGKLSYLVALNIRNIILGIGVPDADPEKGETKQPPTLVENAKN